jgi:hypothetical protein
MLNGTRQRVLLYHTYMASRKPKGIVDDISKGIYKGVKTISSPWLGTPPGQNRSVTQAQGLARSAAETLDQTFAGGMVKAGTQGNKALVKQAGVNAASLAIGYIAGKAVVTSGVVPRIINKVTGKTIGLHGSPVSGLKSIDPRISRSDVDVPTVSFMRTDVPPKMRASNVSVNQQYAGSQGSIYVVKATKATSDLPKFTKPPKLPKVTQSADRARPVIQFQPTVATKTTTSAKVFAEIPVNKFPTEAQLRAEVARQTRLAGSSMRTQSLGDKIKGLTPKKKSSRLNPDVS